MTYPTAAPASGGFDWVVVDDEEFDPLALAALDEPEEGVLDPDEGDIVDMPIVPEVPESIRRRSVFDKERYASPQEAIEELLRRNPARKPVFLDIIAFCEQPRSSSELEELVEAAQAENRSVYTPMALCDILERAGALTRAAADAGESAPAFGGAANGDETSARPALIPNQPAPAPEQLALASARPAPASDYPVSASNQPVPVLAPIAPSSGARSALRELWSSTEAGRAVLAVHREGSALRELIERENCYREIYLRVLEFCLDEPRPKAQIDAIVDDDPLVQSPRRYSNHFIELLENREALAWHDGGWNTTELGARYLDQESAVR